MIKAGEYLENSFYSFIQKYKDFDFESFWKNVTISDIKRAIYSRNPGEKELMVLLSPLAGQKCLEEMAQDQENSHCSILEKQYIYILRCI